MSIFSSIRQLFGTLELMRAEARERDARRERKEKEFQESITRQIAELRADKKVPDPPEPPREKPAFPDLYRKPFRRPLQLRDMWISVYISRTDSSTHYRVALSLELSAVCSCYKYAKFLPDRFAITFSHDKSAGYATVKQYNGRVWINNKQMVEEIFKATHWLIPEVNGLYGTSFRISKNSGPVLDQHVLFFEA